VKLFDFFSVNSLNSAIAVLGLSAKLAEPLAQLLARDGQAGIRGRPP